MKVFYESKYKYTGVLNGYHSFTSLNFVGIDEEIVLVKQAKLIKVSGEVKFYNPPITVEYFSITKSGAQNSTKAKRVRLTNQTKFMHTPQRSIAEDETSVKLEKVNRRKQFSTV